MKRDISLGTVDVRAESSARLIDGSAIATPPPCRISTSPSFPSSALGHVVVNAIIRIIIGLVTELGDGGNGEKPFVARGSVAAIMCSSF